jgi:D-arginine dehydrogenase
MDRRDVLIIGGGFAGAATAWWLKRHGVARVTILEQEDTPGVHASGRNAGIARMATEDPATTLLAARSVSFMRHQPEGFCASPLFEGTGGFLVSCVDDDPRLEAIRKHALAGGVHTYFVERNEVLERMPALLESPFRQALHCPYDGLVDIHALLTSYLAPAEVLTGAKVTGFQKEGTRLTAVETTRGNLRAEWFVDAAGAWASVLGLMAGAVPVKLTPKRRHLLHTGPLDWAAPTTPYVWCLHPAVYFRPESHGLLLSPCDEQPHAPGTPASDPEIALLLAERLAGAFPHLSNLPIARYWAELRTFSQDGGFVIGRDTRLENFLWVAGLAGHGMTASAAVGELAAALLLDMVSPVDPGPYDPARFEG